MIVVSVLLFFYIFFFKQKTAYEMRISDWSSDVCSSDLMESWAFEWAGEGYVLRRAPSAAYMADRPFGHVDEAALVMAAFDAGVKAPEVVGVLEAGDGLGTGYVMRRVMGEVSPAALLDAPPPSLLGDLARELARIHAVPLEKVPAAIPLMDTGAALADLKEIGRASCRASVCQYV